MTFNNDHPRGHPNNAGSFDFKKYGTPESVVTTYDDTYAQDAYWDAFHASASSPKQMADLSVAALRELIRAAAPTAVQADFSFIDEELTGAGAVGLLGLRDVDGADVTPTDNTFSFIWSEAESVGRFRTEFEAIHFGGFQATDPGTLTLDLVEPERGAATIREETAVVDAQIAALEKKRSDLNIEAISHRIADAYPTAAKALVYESAGNVFSVQALLDRDGGPLVSFKADYRVFDELYELSRNVQWEASAATPTAHDGYDFELDVAAIR